MTDIVRRIASSFTAANLKMQDGARHFVKDFWMTRDGQWYGSGMLAPPEWARTDYLDVHPPFDDAGGATHLFIKALKADGSPKDTVVWFRVPGSEHQHKPWTGAKAHGWQNLFMSGSSAYWPTDGQRGPWEWGLADDPGCKVIGGGLVNGWHTSMFVVVQEFGEAPPPDPPTQLEHWYAMRTVNGEVLSVWQAASGAELAMMVDE